MSSDDHLISGAAFSGGEVESHASQEDNSTIESCDRGLFSNTNVIIAIVIALVVLVIIYIAKRSTKRHKDRLGDKSTESYDPDKYDVSRDVVAFHAKQDRYILENGL